MLHSNRKPLDLLLSDQSETKEQGAELTFSELANSYALSVNDQSDLRLRKWVLAFGNLSAWEFNSEQIENASKPALVATHGANV